MEVQPLNYKSLSKDLLDQFRTTYHIQKAVSRLETELDKMSREAESKIKEKIKEWKNKDSDNPLFLNVSLYGAMDFGRLEVAHTNTLAWLLTPTANHNFKSLLLEELLKHLMKEKRRRKNFKLLDGSIVTSEKTTSTTKGNGRIDVWAEGKWQYTSTGEFANWLMVLECKIDHHVTDNQLEKYETYISCFGKRYNLDEVFYVLLSPDKREADTGNNKWQTLSFEDLFTIFWRQAKYLQCCEGYQFLRLYLAGLLRDIQGCTPISNMTDTTNYLYEALVLFDKLSIEDK